ncbi:MAG: hypothetical protein WED10_11280 [Brumimicrobium sp.]
MLNKILTSAVICVILYNYCNVQMKLDTFMKNNNYEVMITMEPFGSSLGYLTKVSHDFLSKNHFEGSLGLAFQNSYTIKTKIEKIMNPNTRVIDYSLLLTNDWKYFPAKKKNLFIAIGLYGGLTSSISKGSLSLPAFNIEEEFYNRYNYFNYGSTQTLGWRFKTRYEFGLFSMISLNGFFDSGRFRPAEVDSRFYIGFIFGYNFGRE